MLSVLIPVDVSTFTLSISWLQQKLEINLHESSRSRFQTCNWPNNKGTYELLIKKKSIVSPNFVEWLLYIGVPVFVIKMINNVRIINIQGICLLKLFLFILKFLLFFNQTLHKGSLGKWIQFCNPSRKQLAKTNFNHIRHLAS